MHVIWKRPDGFQNAVPEDFRRVPLSNGARLWLHASERDWYPFQISGDWAGQDQTARLNRLTNMLDSSEETWREFLKHSPDHDFAQKRDDATSLAQSLREWIESLKHVVKGNTWEVEIVQCALGDIQARLEAATRI